MIINNDKKFTQFFTKLETPRKVDFIVLHHVEAVSVQHAISQFEEHQVSAHFLIDENGEIFCLVDENNIAYHAGISFWRGSVALNKNSIGIEFINSAPFEKEFTMAQMQAAVSLCHYLIEKYNIAAQNIVGHSDIAFLSDTGLLDRKQDPSHLFNWKFLAQNGIGIFPEISLPANEDKILFSLKNKAPAIMQIKKSLAKFGYQVLNLNDEFDQEMQALARVFNRRFNQSTFNKDANSWHLSSHLILDELQKYCAN